MLKVLHIKLKTEKQKFLMTTVNYRNYILLQIFLICMEILGQHTLRDFACWFEKGERVSRD